MLSKVHKGNIVTRSEYDKLAVENESWKEKYAEEQERRKRFQSQVLTFEETIANEKKVEKEKFITEIEEVERHLEESEKRHELYFQKLRKTAGIEAIKSVLENIDKKLDKNFSYHLYRVLESDNMTKLYGSGLKGLNYEFTPKGELFYQYVLDHYYDKNYDEIIN